MMIAANPPKKKIITAATVGIITPFLVYVRCRVQAQLSLGNQGNPEFEGGNS